MRMMVKMLVLGLSATVTGAVSLSAQPVAPPPSATNAPGAKIKFATSVYDFGRAKANDAVKYTYYFTNTGDQILILTNVAPQCGCTAAGDWTRQVEPGKSGKIPIQFNTGNNNGPVVKQVTVTCNDKSQSTLFLQLKGTVYKPYEINPPLVVLNIPPDADTATMAISITNNMEEPLTLSAPEVTTKAFTAELKTIQPGKGYQLFISVVPPLKPGSTQGQVSLKTSLTNTPAFNIPVYANVQPPIVLSPLNISLPPAPLDNPQTASITIRNVSTNAVVLSEPAINAQGVEIQIKETDPGRVFTAVATFPKGFEAPAGQVLELTVKSSNPKCPLVRVPVSQAARHAPPAPPAAPAAIATPGSPLVPPLPPAPK
jgi:hypothetical protein